mgnify:FL=1
MSDYYILQDGNIYGLNFGHLVKKIQIHFTNLHVSNGISKFRFLKFIIT